MDLPTANITIKTGRNPKDYIEIIGKRIDYKRSKVRISRKGEKMTAVIEADDSRALLASMQSLLKQITIVESVDKMLERMSE